jgi:enoyl-[acyl-carrier protein] reductase II
MGTRFIASVEAHAGAVYKQAIVDARDEDTTITRCYTGKTLRALDNAYVRDWETRSDTIQPFPQQAMLSVQADVMGGIGGKLDPLDPNRDCLAMGQGAGAIHDILPCAQIIDQVMAQAEARIADMARLVPSAGRAVA